MNNPNWMHTLWSRIQEPRVVSIVQTLIYALCFTGGLVTIIDPPTSIKGAFGGGVTLAWGIFAVIGGLMGMYSAPTGKWLIEKPAIIACSTAVFLYAGLIITLQFTESGNRIPQLVFVLIGLLHFVNRYWRIKPYSYEPGK